jgi:AraC-like DNA-binding protein
MDPVSHTYAELVYVEWGRGRLELEGRAHTVAGRTWILTTPGQVHRFLDDTQDPLSLITLCFDTALLTAHPVLSVLWRPFRERSERTPVFSLADPFQASRLEDLVRQALFAGQRRDAAGAPLILAWVVQIAAVLLSEPPAPPDDHASREETVIHRCEAWLAGHFTERISVADLAELSGLSYRRFTHLFKKVTGMTAHRRIEDLRLDYACRQLVSTGNIMHASLHAGFEDITTFYRAFKKKTAMTPRRYLEQQGRKAAG